MHHQIVNVGAELGLPTSRLASFQSIKRQCQSVAWTFYLKVEGCLSSGFWRSGLVRQTRFLPHLGCAFQNSRMNTFPLTSLSTISNDNCIIECPSFIWRICPEIKGCLFGFLAPRAAFLPHLGSWDSTASPTYIALSRTSEVYKSIITWSGLNAEISHEVTNS
jgi:hypothetical protein